MVSRKQRSIRPVKVRIHRLSAWLGPVDLMHARYVTRVGTCYQDAEKLLRLANQR